MTIERLDNAGSPVETLTIGGFDNRFDEGSVIISKNSFMAFFRTQSSLEEPIGIDLFTNHLLEGNHNLPDEYPVEIIANSGIIRGVGLNTLKRFSFDM